MSVIENLRVTLGADISSFRDNMQKAARVSSDAAKAITRDAAAFNTLTKGVGERFYAKGVKGALNFNGAQQVANQTLDKSIVNAENYLSSLRSMAVAADSGTSAVRALATQTERSSAANMLAANSSAVLASRIFNTNASVTALQYSLADLDLLNYRLKDSNWVQVWFAGSGKLVYGIDAIKRSLFGIIAPSRAIQKTMQKLIVPGILAFSTSLLGMKDKNPFAALLGENLAKVGRDLERLGTAGRTNFRLLIDDIGHLVSSPLRLLKSSLELNTGLLSRFGLVATQTGLFIGALTKHAFLAASALVSFSVSGAMKATWSLLQLSAAGLKAATIAALKGVFLGVGVAASHLAGRIMTGPVRALMAIPGAAKEATASLLGMSKAKMGAAFGAMDLLGPAAMLGALGSAVYGIFKGAKTGLDWANSAEQVKVSLETMTGSAEKAKMVMDGIKKWGATTPFLIPGLNEAGKQLLAYGVAADQIVPTLRTIGDLSGGSEATFKELVNVYAQLKSQGGTVQLQDLYQIASRGVPIFDELAKVVGKSQVELRQMISAGKIGLPQVQQAFKNLTSEGGKLYNGLTNQTDTIIGQWGRLKEAGGLTFQAIAEAIIKAFDVKGVIGSLTAAVNYVRTNFVPYIVAGLTWIGQAMTAVSGTVMSGWASVAPFVIGAWNAIYSAVSSVITSIMTFAAPAFEFMAAAASASMDMIKNAFLAVEFSFLHWKDLLAYSMVEAAYQLFRFGNVVAHFLTAQLPYWLVVAANEVVHTFTVRIPTALNWFFENWREIFTDLWNFTKTVFTNMASNIWEFIKSIPELIAGTKSFSDIWKPLTDGFTRTVKEFPAIAQREVGGIEAALQKSAANRIEGANEALMRQTAAGLKANLGKEWDELKRQREGVGAPQYDQPIGPQLPPPAPEALKIDPSSPGLEGAKQGRGGKPGDDNKALERGTVEAYSAEKKAKDQVQVQKDIKKGVGETNRLLAESNAIARGQQLQPARIP